VIPPIQLAILQCEHWVESIDKERDRLALSLEGFEIISEIQRAFVRTRLGVLERERAKALELHADLMAKRHRPELMFSARPVMAKAMLEPTRKRRRA
jgi:hypothetical protein